MITVENLDFAYPGKQVLFDIGFTLEKGSVTALVGPNGAGKTTLMRCLSALEIPQTGKVTMAGLDVAENPRKIHRMCGYLSDFFGLYDALTVRQCLTYAAWSQGIAKDRVIDRVNAVLEAADIADMADKPAGVLSRGYRQRLGIAQALIHEPEVLILDEPASGMDPAARAGLSRLVRRLRHEGKTMIVSSHILNELEDYCTGMLVIQDGRVAEHVSLSEHARTAGRTLRIRVAGEGASYQGLVQAQPHVGALHTEGDVILCAYTGDEAAQGQMMRALVGAGLPLVEFAVLAQTLQDAYMNVTKKKGKA